MLSKSKIKFIHSLEQKKCRRQERAFIAEGHKSVGDLLCEGFSPILIVATEEWHSPVTLDSTKTEVITVTEEELRKASLLQHPQQVLGVFQLPKDTLYSSNNTLAAPSPSESEIGGEALILCLDGVQDPGNLGTIIRTADWFGIKDIVCSPLTADAFAPKVVQATMGSIARVNIYYTDLPKFLKSLDPEIPIYGTLLDGNNIYTEKLSHHGVIVMGNEGNGISEEVRELLTHKLLIPPYSTDKKSSSKPSSGHAESLNVSISTAIILSLFRREQG